MQTGKGPFPLEDDDGLDFETATEDETDPASSGPYVDRRGRDPYSDVEDCWPYGPPGYDMAARSRDMAACSRQREAARLAKGKNQREAARLAKGKKAMPPVPVFGRMPTTGYVKSKAKHRGHSSGESTHSGHSSGKSKAKHRGHGDRVH